MTKGNTQPTASNNNSAIVDAKQPKPRIVKDDALTETGMKLWSYIREIERLEQAKEKIADDIKNVYAHVKGDGFHAPCVRKIVASRKRNPLDVAEEEETLNHYKNILGMQ